ncbi:von Willebrand factor type A domain-containing protein [Streptomyces sp. NPDC012888]|uniref:vWA domain-containing protein n=1 Tax=Streptomyces sp. NPDC012888 TaxID=3364855 RepID=UPI0036C53A79
MTFRRRPGARLLAAFAAGAVLLTGCSSGAATGDGTGTAREPARRDQQPLPGGPTRAAPEDGSRTPQAGEPEGRPTAPPADYLSTFALDVDTASYGYARRTLADGRLPSPDGVRPEEFVNSFAQDYPRPEGDGFSVTLDGARAAGGGHAGTVGDMDAAPTGTGGTAAGEGADGHGWSLMRVGLATRARQDGTARPPAALTFVVDVSGSMAEPGRLDLVRASLGMLADQLRGDDSLAVVAFSGTAEVRLPMTRLEGRRDRVHEVVDGLRPSSSTNVEAGVTRGYEVAVEGLRPGATNRVVLLSDALANTGATSADALLRRIEGARTQHGITLFGVGVGSEYGDALMERLADRGDGHTVYVSDREEARRVFVEDLPAQVELRARDAKAQVAFDPRNVERFRLIGYDNRRVADESFRDDGVDGGEVGPGHTVTALYAVRLRPGASGHVATATVRWLDPDDRAPHEESGRIEVRALDRDLWGAGTPERLQVAAVAAHFASELRGRDGGWAPLPGAVGLGVLAEHAGRLAAGSRDPEVDGLAEAVRRAHRLIG